LKKKAREVLEFVRMELKSHYSELLYPLSVLRFKEAPEEWKVKNIVTDGATIYYSPDGVLRQGKELTMAEIMHIVCHGLLGHFVIKDDYEQRILRDLVMDIQANYLMTRLGGMADTRGRQVALDVEKVVKGDYSMGSYYRLLPEDKEISRLKYYQKIVQVDDHRFWDKNMDEGHRKKVREIWGEIQEAVLGENREEGMRAIVNAIVGKGKGDGYGQFNVGKGSGKNYKELLKELFGMQEINKEEPDSIDYMFYHYGLTLYGDVPLIEPLEITERPAIRTLAIAVDVSGSCISGEIMEKFWGETYDCILQVKERYGVGEVLLLQCDEAIQDEKRMQLEEFQETPVQVKVKGWGGTSFVPVFERIEELETEEVKVDALIYLTDGFGECPLEKPAYPVYFVLPTRERNGSYLPDWIQKVCLE